MKMPPSTTRRTTTAIGKGLFLEKGIDITAEQAVVGEIRPGLLLQLVRDHQGRGLVECRLGTAIHIALHIGQHRGVLCQRLHLLLLFGSQHGGHGFPDLAAHAPDLLAAEQHFNGQLSEELRYRHGRLHGISRQWDENGRLLGSFTMNHGMGTQRYWHQNGRLRLEINSLNGKFFGRTRAWLRDGTLVQETYYISNVDVTRAAYLKAARKHPDWQQHEGQTAGRVVRESRALERRQHELFIESLLEKSHAEAGRWLSAAQNPDLRSLAKFRTSTAALRFVETLYAAGAEAVIAVPIYAGRRRKLFADWLLGKLPKAPLDRKSTRLKLQSL